jgi:hypothetical protein
MPGRSGVLSAGVRADSPIPTPVLTGSGSKGFSSEISGSGEPPLRPKATINQLKVYLNLCSRIRLLIQFPLEEGVPQTLRQATRGHEYQ